MKYLLIMLAVVGAMSCTTPLSQVQSTNKEVEVTLITEFDGIKLYRVWCNGNAIYVAKSANSINTSQYVHQGKSGYNQDVYTVEE